MLLDALLLPQEGMLRGRRARHPGNHTAVVVAAAADKTARMHIAAAAAGLAHSPGREQRPAHKRSEEVEVVAAQLCQAAGKPCLQALPKRRDTQTAGWCARERGVASGCIRTLWHVLRHRRRQPSPTNPHCTTR